MNVERVLDRDDLVYEFKDMLKKDGPSMLLIKVNEFVEDAGRVLHDPPEITLRFMKAIVRIRTSTEYSEKERCDSRPQRSVILSL